MYGTINESAAENRLILYESAAKRITSRPEPRPSGLAERITPRLESRPSGLAERITPRLEPRPSGLAERITPRLEPRPSGLAERITPRLEPRPSGLAERITPRLEPRPSGLAERITPRFEPRPSGLLNNKDNFSWLSSLRDFGFCQPCFCRNPSISMLQIDFCDAASSRSGNESSKRKLNHTYSFRTLWMDYSSWRAVGVVGTLVMRRKIKRVLTIWEMYPIFNLLSSV
ncbi:hypothetical protein RND81_06G153200 [Saponaria officinalis]|uniref:Uncharacterized protein n=1 Tax=Saponaria officinalis TaxID=3572 RepID=A0AAW1KBM5_SAPOF